ncbi:MAG TPA: glycosyltransferase family 4 protein [Thermoplasmata archaeon]|nr:glycosyltransferase family 4 protein [Thermoplasmata archaeon]
MTGPVYVAATRYAIFGSMRTHALRVTAALRSIGVPVQLVTPRYYGRLKFGGAFLTTARMLIRRTPADHFVHAIDVESCYRGAGVLTVHDGLVWWETSPRVREFPYRWQWATGLRRARRIVAVSESTADRVRTLFPDVSKKIRVIPPPFETKVSDPTPKERDAIWIGRNDPPKGFVTFLEALRDPRLATLRVLVKWTPQARWPELTVRARELLRRLPQVESFEGPVEYSQLERWMAGSRCLVSTSNLEGLHAVPLEAYMFRTRIVLPRMHPYVEMYSPNAEGVHWFESGNHADLVRAIEEATSAPANFTPDPATLDRVSYRTVGNALLSVYREAGWQES